MVTTDISMPSGKTRKDNLDETVLARIDQYELVSELGGGGFGTVYLAKDTTSGVQVAVKGLPPFVKNNREELENIRENFALVSRLTHTNIAKALVLHPAKDVSYASEDTQQKLRVFADDFLMVMEYAPGVTLSKWRKQFPERRAPVPNAIAIVRQIASALDYAHGQHIIHRDIKPANVMIETQADGKLIARVLDFGLAAEIRSSMGHVSREIHDTSGTRPYMAPEQWLGGRQGAATDQYSLAVLFHELVTGDVPFASVFDTGDPMVMLNAIGHNPVELPDDLPACVRAALEKALSKKPSDRFESCTDFVDALDGKKMVEPLTSPDHVTKPDNPPPSPPRPFPVRKIAISLFAMAAIGVCSWFAMSQIAHQDKSMPLPEPTLQPATHLQPIPSPQPAPPQPAPAPVPKVDEAMKSEALIMKGKAGQARDRNAKEEWHSWPLFDTRARDVESLYRAGVEAFDKADYKLAKEMFAKIRENMRWLDSNKALRISASAIRFKVLSSKSDAESTAASRFASSEWESALAYLSAAERLFADGQFKQSESNFTSAEDAFRRAEKIAKAAKKSADRANATSKFIAAYNEKRYDDAAQLRHDIDLNNVTVQFDLGWMYANGSGLSKDDKEAVKWYRKAAEQGNAAAQSNLGLMYANGRGVLKDDSEAYRWYLKAASQGNPYGQCNLGEAYEEGKGVAKDEDEALKWYDKAIESGSERARTLSESLRNKRRKTENTRLAIKAFSNKEWSDGFRLSQSADRDDSTIQFYIGVCYDNGYGVNEDDSEAVRWYRKAAENGSLMAQFNLGVMYYKGEGVAKDERESEKWYRKAAEGGYEKAKEALERIEKLKAAIRELADLKARERKNTDEALIAFRGERWYDGFKLAQNADKNNRDIQFFIGVCHFFGYGGASQNDMEAAKWFKKASDQGHDAAQANLGGMYLEGKGVSVDYTEGIRLLRKSADRGNAKGLRMLSVAYENGVGVQQDYVQAIRYLKQAEKLGDTEAGQKMTQLRGQVASVILQLQNEYNQLQMLCQQPFPNHMNIRQLAGNIITKAEQLQALANGLMPYADNQQAAQQSLTLIQTLLQEVRQVKQRAEQMMQNMRQTIYY